MQHQEFTLAVLHWFEENGRELPWRGSQDPYAIWLSEIILQQTRIAQGTEYWHRFMQRWPNVELLAAASGDEVLKEWQGLGYYSRARNLHHAAQQIVQLGHFPQTYEEIRALKGVGDYTAAAISSMAFSLPHAAVDGNVYRVLSRYYGIATPINSTEGKAEFQQLDNELLPHEQAGTWNQAMMDFGAIQCTPAAPRCLICPLQESCYALRNGKVSELPVKEKNIKRRERFFTYYYIRYQGQVAIHQRQAGDIWQGLWEPMLKEAVFPIGASLVKHVLTHQTLYARMIVEEPKSKPQLPEGYIWIQEADLENYALPRLIEKLL
ncbi:MAG: A/G-specific adenine glycosylase [Prevotella sp.]|jgi:A/G-specific adenine glycosylase|nr:A/G-specific adenine glycosylase [Prevotella sp.]MCI1281968.1 A/G-specific adenine glycosylase [Prevotella sp.]